ncbi:putative hemerythrin HHE cation binding domain protein [Actinacidiphila reveromycinica]|uniref:Putative hemerythrin HHE cation binding domain protein n=1 Tax=Actinacidiphila reveromycinica TaxID=659352 RepID=A0A7U3VLG9_9ACTN|nr:hemerythrin domain-containing protein [Streptomyces sp. SN-593]BBA95540.1 putative hemerythrin HHE cation binding domain protein [Streptomyces sp. SN-593]
MSSATIERTAAARLPDGDVVAVLLTQHARIRDLFASVRATRGDVRRQAFDELRALLAVHEVAEELIVRPVAKRTAGEGETEARNSEEAEATRMLKRLEHMDVDSAEFDAVVEEFERAVGEHADHEESDEFPSILRECTAEQRHTMGERLARAERMAPTHPHPAAAGKPVALALTGPFAAMTDKVRDAMTR